MKIINIKDKNTKILVLDRGEYIINGKRYSFPNYCNRIETQELKELKKVNTTQIVVEYFDEINQKKITVNEYAKRKRELEDKRLENDYGELEFEDLDDEYNYKKFVQYCKPIYKTIETISDNLQPAEEAEIIYDTKNKYIKCRYFTEKEKEPFLYYYDREQALKDIVKNKFNELGFEFIGDCNYEQTKNKKVWANSENSGIRYAKAFGTYLFGDAYDNCRGITESLEKCIEYYEEDKENIESIIMRKYNEEYAKIDKEKLKALPELVNNLEYRLNKVHTYKSSSTDFWNAKKTVKEIQELINESFV